MSSNEPDFIISPTGVALAVRQSVSRVSAKRKEPAVSQ